MSADAHPAPGALDAGESLFAGAPRAPLGGALWTSVALHVGLVAAALLTLAAAPPTADSTSMEAISVELVSSDAFSSEAPATSDSSAALAMLAAGATSPALETPPVTEPLPEPEPTVEPPQEPEPPPEPVAETPPEPPPPAPPAEVAPTPDAWEAAPLLAVAAVDTEPSPVSVEAPAPDPVESSEPPGKAPPKLDPEPAPRPKPIETPVEAKPVEKPKAKPVEAEKPKDKPKDKKPAEKPKAASAGSGGKNEADAAAAKASAGKSGKAGDGAAAVSKYPGLVQKALRRALRFPKGAGRSGGEAQVQFTVSASGSVSGISVVRSTGNPVLDAEAVKTVQRAAPFPPIPADAGRKSWTFTMPLLFKR